MARTGEGGGGRRAAMCFSPHGEPQAPLRARRGSPAPRGSGSGAALSPPAAPASLPRRPLGCPVPVPACRSQETTGNPAKVDAEEVQGEPKAAGRRAATWDGRAADAGRRRRGRASSPGGVPAETYLCPRGAAGRRRAGRARSRAGRRRCPREGPSRRSRPDAGAGARAARSRGGPGGSPAPRRSAPLSAAPRPAARAFAQPQPQRQWRPRSRLAAKQRHQEAAGV